jgi:putative endonuclease
VYVIQSSNRKIYIGQTDNIEQRLKRHNRKARSKVTSYTHKQGNNWKVVYSEVFQSRHDAFMREKYLKSHVGRDWLKIVIGPVAQR